MSNIYSLLHSHKHLLSRTFYGDPTAGTLTITAPAGALFIRASAVGAGSGQDNGQYGVPGGGAAFARVKTTTHAGEQFTLQVGAYIYAKNTGTDTRGFTILTRVTGSSIILQAVSGAGTAGGAASSCVGDTKRSGSPQSGGVAGASAGDDSDPLPLGFGGRGVGPNSNLSAAPGGGGYPNHAAYRNQSGSWIVTFDNPGGDGRACIEFFDKDPATWGYGS